jgi:preprotein translocase subunit SecA
MSAATIIRPAGIAAAAVPPATPRLSQAIPYPEHQVRPVGIVEEHLRAAAAVLPRPSDMFGHLAARRVARLARAHARDATLAAEAPELAAASLRKRLRTGITQDAAARSFALIRVVAARHLGLTPYDVQLMAAWSMLRGQMAELATGEGKTLAASLAAATAAMAGRMVHVVTVNDYLAGRDHALLAPLYRALGLSAGLVVHGQTPAERRAAYACDIVYASNKELVFDYLRDQMRRRGTPTVLHGRVARLDGRRAHEDALVLRGLDFAIIDEADSVLIDEARTPLIISETMSAGSADRTCVEALDLVAELLEGQDYRIDRSERRIDLTPAGKTRVETLSATLGDHWGSTVVRSELVVKALTARLLFERDVHYLMRDGRVCIIDEYTGRIMPDRFWNDGLHQMIEAKEGCAPSSRRGSVARITYQRFFARYRHLCGMSGTLAEITHELRTVYGVGVARIPTHHPCRRGIEPTVIAPTATEKWRSIADHAVALAATGRPVLIGTRSVAASERASALLHGHGVAHDLLNAAQDSAEAAIVARAGEAGRITIATNMAGRGTDIRLEDGVSDRGGLAVILSDRHDAARIDRQLAGRGARQGDAGSFLQVLSLEDALMDPLRAHGTGRVLLTMARAHRRLACLLFALMQRRAERRHRVVRRELMRFETRLQASLSFAGRPD